MESNNSLSPAADESRGSSGNSEEKQLPTLLYVGNLDYQITDDFLFILFSRIGQVKSCRILNDGKGNPYAFVDFWEHSKAQAALAAMNRRFCFGREIRVNWANYHVSNDIKPGANTNEHYQIFVGDLCPSTKTEDLKTAFASFGVISDCRIVRDPLTLRSKGYGFVTFVDESAAKSAIVGMNGQWIGDRAIRTNWAAGKKNKFDEVFNDTESWNRTIYFGGMKHELTEELIRETFSRYGSIENIRAFYDRGYAFITFTTKEAAAWAIVMVHQTKVQGQTVRCSWSRIKVERRNPIPSQMYDPVAESGANANMRLQFDYNQPEPMLMGYWYPQSGPYNAPLNQFPQLNPGYSYSNYGRQNQMRTSNGM